MYYVRQQLSRRIPGQAVRATRAGTLVHVSTLPGPSCVAQTGTSHWDMQRIRAVVQVIQMPCHHAESNIKSGSISWTKRRKLRIFCNEQWQFHRVTYRSHTACCPCSHTHVGSRTQNSTTRICARSWTRDEVEALGGVLQDVVQRVGPDAFTYKEVADEYRTPA
jgi:hypothetical protein